MRECGAKITHMGAHKPPSEEKREIGKRLRKFRKDQGLRPMEVAVVLGCTQQNYEFYEAGRQIIGSDRLREFAAALQTDPHTLHDVLYPVEPFTAELVTPEREKPEPESSRLTGRTREKVTVSRSARPRHPSIGAPLAPMQDGSLVRC